ncbi:MAG: hypothetical protein AB8G22_28410 [Saprospiraceae bacterium]
MQLLLDVQAEKLPFVLELLQQLDGVNIVKLENNQLPQIAQQLFQPSIPSSPPTTNHLNEQMNDLQNEIDDLFGKS